MALAVNNRNPNSAGLNKEDIVFLKKCRGGELFSDLKDHQEPRISPFFPIWLLSLLAFVFVFVTCVHQMVPSIGYHVLLPVPSEEERGPKIFLLWRFNVFWKPFPVSLTGT